jgi:hypothetical protein
LTSQCDVKCKIGNVTNAGRFASQDGANRNFDFFFSNNTTGILSIRCNTAFATQVNSSVGLGITSTYSGWVRFTYLSNGVNADVKFYTSSDGTTWTQLGTTQTIISTGLSFGTCALGVGGNEAGGYNAILGYVYRVLISSTIDGAAQRDFNPNQYNASTSQTQWTSTTGEVWTINTGTDATGYKGVLVDRTIVQSDGIDDLLNATISGSGRFTQYLAVSPFGSIASNEAIAGPWDLGNWRGAIYTSSSSFATYQGGLADGFFGSTITKARLNLVGVVNSSTGTDWQPFINGTDVSNGGLNIGSQNDYTSVGIFARSLGVTFTNSLVNSYILGKQADNSTQRTAIYNYIRSLNNNAF